MKSQRGQALLEFALVTVFVVFAALALFAALAGLFAGPPDVGPGAGHNGYSRLMQ